jgi:hypothetical protein
MHKFTLEDTHFPFCVHIHTTFMCLYIYEHTFNGFGEVYCGLFNFIKYLCWTLQANESVIHTFFPFFFILGIGLLINWKLFLLKRIFGRICSLTTN